MKKKIFALIIPMFIFLGIVNVDAASVNVKCNDVTVGQTTTCTISVSGAGATSAISGKVSINGVTYNSASAGSGFTGTVDSSSFDLYRANNVSGSYVVASYVLNTGNVGTYSINVSNVIAYNENYDQVNFGSASGSFRVTAVQTAPTTTTTQPKTYTTTTPTTRRVLTQTVYETTTIVTEPVTSVALRLNTVTVDDFDVTYSGGVYYATVTADTEEVTVGATADDSLVIIGTGKRTLVEGNNKVELIVRDAQGNSSTYKVIITRPAGSGVYNTKLTNLEVANYPFAFSPDTLEYTITVPYNTNQIYVVAEGSDDVIIQGDGMITLSGKTTDVTINVSYGDLQTTQYVIHVKKSYGMLFMWIAIGTLGIGIVAALVYANVNRKAAVAKAVNEKNKVIAAGAREMASNSVNAGISLGGSSIVGTGRTVQTPTRVVEQREAAPATVAAGVVKAQTATTESDMVKDKDGVNVIKASSVVTATPVAVKPQPVKVVRKVISPQTQVSAVHPTVVKTIHTPTTVVTNHAE